jgi:hypothetical protein
MKNEDELMIASLMKAWYEYEMGYLTGKHLLDDQVVETLMIPEELRDCLTATFRAGFLTSKYIIQGEKNNMNNKFFYSKSLNNSSKYRWPLRFLLMHCV